MENISGTTPKFWDCECKVNYIKPKSQHFCSNCITWATVQPDSLITEVVAVYGEKAL